MDVCRSGSKAASSAPVTPCYGRDRQCFLPSKGKLQQGFTEQKPSEVSGKLTPFLKMWTLTSLAILLYLYQKMVMDIPYQQAKMEGMTTQQSMARLTTEIGK